MAMQQAVQNTSSPLERNITVSVPIEQIEAEIAARLKQLARTVKMQGFRPGHVPLKMVERHYGFQVRQEVVSDSVQKSFSEAVREQNFRVAGYPRFQPVERAAVKGDLVNIDFEGVIAGQPFEGNMAANFTVILGEQRMLPDFEASLVGMKAGETKTFPVTFPQD